MTWIEGIGDEVTLFFMITLVIIVGAIAWVSTSTADQPFIRTVLILERRTAPREIVEPVETSQAVSIDSNIDTGQSAVSNISNGESLGDATYLPFDTTNTIEETREPVWSSEDDAEQNEGEPEQLASWESDNHSSNPPPVRPDIVTDEDVERCSLRSLRLSYLNTRSPRSTRLEEPVAETFQTESPINDTYKNLVGNIRIRLKYLNDDQKMVDGHLEEQLGDFKRRHFSPELSADKLVRLIFNGHVLQSDSETLQSCGLFDNCVVHCLVHPQRRNTTNQSELSMGRDGNQSTNATNAMEGVLNRDWDMGNVLLISLSLVLGVAWYCRFSYGQLFNATTTVALVGLTGILFISFVGTFLPDQDFTRL